MVDTDLFYVDTGRMPGEAAAALDAASAAGLRVVLVGDPPERGLSGADIAAEDQAVRAAIAAVLARPTTRVVAEQSDVLAALQELGVRPAAAWDQPVPVYTQWREDGDASYVLLWNATDQPQAFTGTFATDGAPTELDLWEGVYRPLAIYERTADGVALPVDLAPHEVRVVAFLPEGRGHLVATSAATAVTVGAGTAELRDPQGGTHTAQLSDGTTVAVELPEVADAPLEVGGLGGWALQVDTYGQEGVVSRPAIPLATLADWRTIPGLASESGIGTYTATVSVPEGWTGEGRGSLLDLGAFDGAVQLSVNGQRVTANIDPTEPVDVTGFLQPGDNTVEVVLATTPFNKAVVSPGTTATRPLFPTSLEGETQSYGLLGPVRLIPVRPRRP